MVQQKLSSLRERDFTSCRNSCRQGRIASCLRFPASASHKVFDGLFERRLVVKLPPNWKGCARHQTRLLPVAFGEDLVHDCFVSFDAILDVHLESIIAIKLHDTVSKEGPL
jgi:hypothetical protein